MKQISIILLSLLLGYSWVFGQQKKAKQAIFAEIGGMAPDFSVNYRKDFARLRDFPLAFRLGLSITRSVFALPLGLEAISPEAPHHLQLAAGITPFVIDYDRKKNQNRDDTDTFLDLVIGVGYRYEAENANWFMAIMVYPKLRLDPAESDYFELSPEGKLAFGFLAGLNL